MNAFSSEGENGTGLSGAAMRRTGASSCSNASSAIVAAISAPKPPVLRVLVEDEHLGAARDALEHRLAVPRDQRAQVEHLDGDAVVGELRRRLVGRVDHRAPGDHGDVVARAVDAGLAERRRVAVVRHLALDAPVEVLVLEEQDGVRVLDRGDEQALRVLGRRRAHDLEAGDVREARLRVLRVERPAREAAAGRKAQHDRDRRAGAVVLLRGDGDEVVPGAGDEVRELHLRHRPHAHQRRAGRAGDDRRLRERHVEHAPRAELLLEAQRHLEGAAVDADVLAEDEDALVAAHLLPEAVGDRLEVGLLGHLLVVRRVELLGRREDAVEHGRGVGQG